jgi:hypothetical protein
MTPERKEEIRRENEELKKKLKVNAVPSLVRKSGHITELLAALEEAQQTIAKQRKALEYYASQMCIQPQDIGLNIGYIARKTLMELKGSIEA